MFQAQYNQRILKFNEPGGTSRGVLLEKPSWFIKVWNFENPACIGIGEVSVIPGLSPDDLENIEFKIEQGCSNINNLNIEDSEYWEGFPAVRFGFETALLDLKNGGKRILFPSAFSQSQKGIEINGLVWMGDLETMQRLVHQKIEEGFRCIKLKIGAIDFQKELKLIELISTQFGQLEIRLDANGAFSPGEALNKLHELNKFRIHSIEQPIKPRQWQQMAEICLKSPIPVALDEELIGLESEKERKEMLETIKPQYIIIKPSLVGGLAESEKWISLAHDNRIDWWATSALESNIGLNAIAQWCFIQKVVLPQGLGTGKVFSNNFLSPLEVINGQLWYLANKEWDF
jgi:o-succinylbenzoate synthase